MFLFFLSNRWAVGSTAINFYWVIYLWNIFKKFIVRLVMRLVKRGTWIVNIKRGFFVSNKLLYIYVFLKICFGWEIRWHGSMPASPDVDSICTVSTREIICFRNRNWVRMAGENSLSFWKVLTATWRLWQSESILSLIPQMYCWP